MSNFTEEVVDGVRTLTAKRKYDCEHLLNGFMTDDHYEIVIDDDCDFYAPPIATIDGAFNNEDNLGFRFRKGIFTKEQMEGAYEGLLGAATFSNNRGTSTGTIGDQKQGNRDWVYPWQKDIMDLITNSSLTDLTPQDIMDKYIAENGSLTYHWDKRASLWHRGKITGAGYEYDNFFLNLLNTNQLTIEKIKEIKPFITETMYTAAIQSGIAGFYDRYPRIPFGRATNYTENNMEKFAKSYPYMRTLDRLFRDLVPGRYAKQKKVAESIDKRFIVAEDTAFSTITVNKNYRTTAHRDGANLNGGFSNLSSVTKGDIGWEGGLFVLPEYKVAINLRPGDALLVDNAGIIHGNTEIIPPAGMDIEDMERISMVSYMRDGMQELKSKEYEDARRDYVTERSRNKDHELWKERWNGVSEGMWSETEWLDYLESKGITDEDGVVTRNKKETASLEDFF